MSRKRTARRTESWLRHAVVLLAAGSLIASLVPLAARAAWLADLFAHFRLQYFVIQTILLLACVGLRRWRWAATLVACLALNGWALLPRFPAARTPAADEAITLISANVWAGNPDATALIERIHETDPDIVILLEHTGRLEPQLETLRDEYPFIRYAPSSGFFGLALLSRLPIASAEIVPNGPTDYLRAFVTSAEGTIELIGLHVLPPVSPDTWRTRNTQLATLATKLSGNRGPLVVCGDFNVSPYSPFFRDFATASGLEPAPTTHPLTPTWPSFFPLLGIPIDHCLTSERVTVNDVRVLGNIGSDHYPILIRFTADGTK